MHTTAPSGASTDVQDLPDAPCFSRWGLTVWAIVAAALLAQVLGLSAYLRHHGISYTVFYGFSLIATRLGAYLAAAIGLRFVLWRWFRQSTAWRPLGRPANMMMLTLEMLTLTAALTLTSYAYSWPKVMLPVLNPKLWDALFARIDSALCLGINPNEFLLTVFGGTSPLVSRALDSYYGLFLASQSAISAWFITEPQIRKRVVFGASFISLWVLGAWSYAVMPALGPVYAFEGYLQRIAAIFPANAYTQVALFKNYEGVLQLIAGNGAMISPHLGVAAMPSLHVAVHFFLFLWARRVGSRLSPLLLAMTTLTLIGSVAICWHYLTDGLVGMALAGCVFGIGVGVGRVVDTRFKWSGADGTSENLDASTAGGQ